MYIKFETAKLAKEKGFNVPTWECFNSKGKPIDYSRNIYAYENDGKFISKPTQSDLQKWLREEHKINVESNWLPNIEKYRCLFIPMDSKKPKTFKTWREYDNYRAPYLSFDDFETYEEALEQGLIKGLELIEKKEE